MAVEKEIITPELKEAGNKLVWLKAARDEYDLPVYSRIMEQYSKFTEDISTPCPSNTCKTSIESSFMHIQPVIAYSVGKMT